MKDELLAILADPIEYFRTPPPGVEPDYSDRSLPELRGDVNHIYDVVRKLVTENDRLRKALLITNNKLTLQRRLTKGALSVAFSAWALVAYFGKIALPLILKGALKQ